MPQIPFFAFMKGANVNISPLIQPQDQPSILNGCNNTYKIGAILKDTGYANIGSALQAGKSVLGLFNFIQTPGTEKMLATVDDATSDDTQLFYSTGAGWTEVTAAETEWANTAGMNVDMESFLAYAFIVGHGATDGYMEVGTLNGTTFGYIGDGSETNISDGSSTANVTMPKAKYIKRYRDRLYVANCEPVATAEPYRVYFSDVPSSGTIVWDRTNNFIDVDYSDEITGLATNWDRLVVFTAYRAYMYDQASFKQTWDYGCSNNRTIKNSGPYMMWANFDGVWVSTGGQPQNVSGEVIDFIRGATPANFFAEIIDEEYHLYVGNVTVDGIAYTNCVLTYNIPLSAWRWRELADNATIFARYNDSGTQRLWFGDASGDVHNKGKYTDATLLNDDDGTDIVSHFELPPMHIQDLSIVKKMENLHAYASKAQGLKLYSRVLDSQDRNLTPYKPIGEMTDYINSFQVDVDDGVLLQIMGTEYGSAEYWSFYGFTLEIRKQSDVLKSKGK